MTDFTFFLTFLLLEIQIMILERLYGRIDKVKRLRSM